MDIANQILVEAHNLNSHLYTSMGLAHSSREMKHAARASMIESMTQAEKYVLDAAMSEYLGHLAVTPFRVNKERRPELMDSLRHSAIPRHEKMFVEYSNRNLRTGLLDAGANKTDLFGKALYPGTHNEVIDQEGFMILRYDNLVKVSMFISLDGQPTRLPFDFLYTTDDAPITYYVNKYLGGTLKAPLKNLDLDSAQLAHGITGYVSPNYGVFHMATEWRLMPGNIDVVDEIRGKTFATNPILPEFAGALRYVIAFLATLNTSPVQYESTRPSKGYIAGGKHRPYMRTTTVRLQLPNRKSMRKLALEAIAAARRGRHKVAGFFRCQPAHGGNYCATNELHIWGPNNETNHSWCKECGLQRIWIDEFWRGDAALGYVGKSKYIVEHPTK